MKRLFALDIAPLEWKRTMRSPWNTKIVVGDDMSAMAKVPGRSRALADV